MAAQFCAHGCGTRVISKTPWGRFCSTKCRYEDWLERRAVELLPRLIEQGRVEIRLVPPPAEEVPA